MALVTRWILGRPVGSLTIIGKAGLCPSVWKHVASRAGLWMGALDVRGMTAQLVALTWDTGTIVQASVDSDIAALVAAPAADAVVLPDSGNLGTWGKLVTLKATLEGRKQDGNGLRGGTTARDAKIEIARGMLLQQSLAVHDWLVTRTLADKPHAMPAAVRTMIDARRRARALDAWQQTDTVRVWMRRELDAGFALQHVTQGAFALGRREAHLR